MDYFAMTVTENDVHCLSAVLVRNFARVCVCVRVDQVRESPNFVNFCLTTSFSFFRLHKLKLILLIRQSNCVFYKNLDTSCYICFAEHFHRWCYLHAVFRNCTGTLIGEAICCLVFTFPCCDLIYVNCRKTSESYSQRWFRVACSEEPISWCCTIWRTEQLHFIVK